MITSLPTMNAASSDGLIALTRTPLAASSPESARSLPHPTARSAADPHSGMDRHHVEPAESIPDRLGHPRALAQKLPRG
jgi:hypothetical protein